MIVYYRINFPIVKFIKIRSIDSQIAIIGVAGIEINIEIIPGSRRCKPPISSILAKVDISTYGIYSVNNSGTAVVKISTEH